MLLSKAGSCGYLVEARIPALAVKDGKVRIRLVSDAGLLYNRRLTLTFGLPTPLTAKRRF